MKNKIVKAIILAGGYSKRIDSRVPKQLLKIEKKSILAYTLDVFEKYKQIDSIILVANRKYIPQFRNLIKKHRYKKIEQVCLGGRTRQQSVFNALKKTKNCDYVIIHDGVRPFVTRRIISRAIKAAKEFGAAACAVKAVDTIVAADKGYIDSLLCRNKLWHIQTPQAFKFDLILHAHLNARSKKIFDSTDDAQLAMKFGKKVIIVQGSYQNLKISSPFDLYLARLLLQNRRKV